jgi:2-polyprenyl-6-methoxyphenol hydroxylase-like FAD-dependent oxidoreductase
MLGGVRGSAAVVGGGIGGLAVACALHAGGWSVRLFEREAGLSGAGTALGMWPSALAALDRIGVGAGVRSLGTAQVSARFLRADGTSIGTLDVERLRRRTGDPVYLLSRPALLGLLREAAPAAALRFGVAIRDVGPLREEFDVVVAADGIFSRVRGAVLGDRSGGRFAARYTGVTAWRGWIDGMATHALTETWGPGAKFGVTPQEGGRTNWYATTVAPEGDFTPGRELARLRELFGSWRGPARHVLDAITEDAILRHDLYVVPKLPAFVAGNVVLIGDAAHAMTPDLGRGACEALVDAVALADCLREGATVAGGLRAYDRQRRRRTQRLASAAAAASRLTRWTRALWLRDALLRASLLVPPPG